MLADCEEIAAREPGLEQNAEYASSLRAGLGADALGHLALQHAGAAGYAVFVVKHAEEDLRGDVVGIVANDAELLAGEERVEVHAQEVALYDAAVELGEVGLEVCHALCIDFDDAEVVAAVQEHAREHAHAGANLEHRGADEIIERGGDALGHGEVGEKMLAKSLFRTYFRHKQRVLREITKTFADGGQNLRKKGITR